MKTKDILIQLVEYLNRYETEAESIGASVNFTDFLGFLNGQCTASNIKAKELRGNYQGNDFADEAGSDTDISILIVLLFRYAKSYIKKALKDSIMNTADEFSFLITLMTFDSLSKSELIQKQVMEKTSGTEVINRLLKNELITQYNDENDKRSVRVRITPKGRMELVQILPQMQVVSQIVTGRLDEKEKTTLAYMLRKLEHYHNDIFLNKKETELVELLQQQN